MQMPFRRGRRVIHLQARSRIKHLDENREKGLHDLTTVATQVPKVPNTEELSLDNINIRKISHEKMPLKE